MEKFDRRRMMQGSRITTAILFLLALLGSARAEESTQTVVVPGSNCIVTYNTDTEEIRSAITQMDCPQDEGKPIKVRYAWMDPKEVSFLLIGYSDGAVDGILGQRPIVVQNEVYRTLEGLYAKYGARGSDAATGLSYTVSSGSVTLLPDTEPMVRALNRMPARLRQKFRAPAFEGSLIWPEVDFASYAKDGNWPDDYRYKYEFTGSALSDTARGFLRQMRTAARRNQFDLSTLISECMAFEKSLTKSDWDNYWPSVDALAERYDSGTAQPWEILAGYKTEQAYDFDIIKELSDNETYAFWDEIFKDGYPDGFLKVDGFIRTDDPDPEPVCAAGEEGGYDFHVYPPDLKVLVAVIMPMSENVVVRSATVVDDRQMKLRREVNLDPQQRTMNFGEIELSKAEGTSLIVPLQIGFSEEDSEADEIPATDISKEVGAIFDEFPEREVKFYRCESVDEGAEEKPECGVFLASKLKNFPKAAQASETRQERRAWTQPEIDYTYGNVHQILDINVNGNNVTVRDPPEVALVVSQAEGEGSCPFVYFEMADGTIQRFGRVLVGALGPDRLRRDVVEIPEGAKRLIVREIEPEISYISSIAFQEQRPESDLVLSAASKFLTLHPRQGISIQIPDGAKFAEVEGYYVLLTRDG